MEVNVFNQIKYSLWHFQIVKTRGLKFGFNWWSSFFFREQTKVLFSLYTDKWESNTQRTINLCVLVLVFVTLT